LKEIHNDTFRESKFVKHCATSFDKLVDSKKGVRNASQNNLLRIYMRLGVIFQGGGAKLVSLLAAAQVLEEIESESDLEIVAAAGTSAGALSAFALASKTPAADFRIKTQAAGERMMPLVSKHLKSRYRSLWRLSRGKPILPENTLEDFVRDFCSGSEDFLKDTNRRLHVCASDRVVESLADSAAIPMIFRSQKSKRQYVDGGICSNLPDAGIFDQDGVEAILALSFDDEEYQHPESLGSFVGSLMSTSIEHSMKVASLEIERCNGIVVKLPRSFGTLEFERAMETLRNDNEFNAQLDLVRQRVSQAISELRERPTVAAEKDVVGAPNTVEKSRRVISGDDPLYVALRRLNPFRCLRTEVRLLGFDVCPAPRSTEANRDELVHIVTYEPSSLLSEGNIKGTDQQLSYVRVGVLVDLPLEQAANIGIEIKDKFGIHITASSMIQFQSTLNQDTGKQVSQTYYVHVFDEPVPVERTPVTVTQTINLPGLSEDLRDHGTDCIRTFCRRGDAPEQVFSIAVPNEFGKIKVSDLHENEHRLKAPERLANTKASHSSWSFGRPLTPEEKAEIVASVRARSSDFEVYGWCVPKAKEDTYMGCLIERIP
jgi:predicted acylesterase/phospholipase RssA